jgi:dihydroflavonol-4-reductase
MNINSRIFVTGGTGLIGSYVLRYLVRLGFTNVHATCRPESRKDLVAEANDKITWHESDINDPVSLEDVMAGAEYVIHLAGLVTHADGRLNELLVVNQNGTHHVVQACLHLDVKYMVHVSSSSALGRYYDQLTYDEKTYFQDSPLNTDYAKSKSQSELEVWRGVAEGLQAVILSPTQVIGGGYWNHGTGRMFKHIWNGRPFYPMGASGWTDARDVARYIIETLNKEIPVNRILINGENQSFKTAFQWIAEGMDYKSPRYGASPFISGLMWRLQRLRQLLLGVQPDVTRMSSKNSARVYQYDNKLSLTTLPNFMYTPIRKTIVEVSSIYKYSHREGNEFGILPLNHVATLRKSLELTQSPKS